MRYPPYSYPENTTLTAYHNQFSVYPPADKIGDYPRHIPYNSEKKVFADKMGRDYFEVLQYTFKVPGEAADSEFEGGKTYTMLWDYNVGLVRGTPLFKCCGYGKTTPAKMLNRNVGLREICHSITGGALVAQGMLFCLGGGEKCVADGGKCRLLDPVCCCESDCEDFLLQYSSCVDAGVWD